MSWEKLLDEVPEYLKRINKDDAEVKGIAVLLGDDKQVALLLLLKDASLEAAVMRVMHELTGRWLIDNIPPKGGTH